MNSRYRLIDGISSTSLALLLLRTLSTTCSALSTCSAWFQIDHNDQPPNNGSQLSNQSVSVIISLLKVIVMTIYGIHHIMHWVHIRPVGVHLQEGQAERIPQPPQADCCLPWNTIRYLQKMRQLVGTISDGWEKDKYQMKTFTGWL